MLKQALICFLLNEYYHEIFFVLRKDDIHPEIDFFLYTSIIRATTKGVVGKPGSQHGIFVP
jgi:hypothetical protein